MLFEQFVEYVDTWLQEVGLWLCLLVLAVTNIGLLLGQQLAVVRNDHVGQGPRKVLFSRNLPSLVQVNQILRKDLHQATLVYELIMKQDYTAGSTAFESL